MNRLARIRGLIAATLVAGGIGCKDEPPTAPVLVPYTQPPTPTDAHAITLTPPDNVLSARVSFTITSAPDSVRVSVCENGAELDDWGTPSFTTPFRSGKAVADTIDVLGLKPSTTYTYRVDAKTGGITKSSSVETFTTADLPQDLIDIKMWSLSGTTANYVVTGVQTPSGGYAVAFDPAGAIVWYHDFTATHLQVSDVMLQPNGNFTAFIGNTSGFQPLDGYYVEFTPGGREVRTYRAPAGYYMDNHEIRLTGKGTATAAHYMTYNIQPADLTDFGGRSNVALAGHQIVRQDNDGFIDFFWNAWDHIAPDEWLGDDNTKHTRASTDFDHPNAISFDEHGNYIVSWRNLNQVMAIDGQTGSILWRLGGAKGEFRFINDPRGGFSKQHSVKILSNGNVLLYDNGTDQSPQETRAVEYKLDYEARTATMVWEYHHDEPIYTAFVGWVERLRNGDTWVGFSLAGRAVEVSPTGAVMWEGQLRVNGANGSVYRLLPVASLYQYVTP